VILRGFNAVVVVDGVVVVVVVVAVATDGAAVVVVVPPPPPPPPEATVVVVVEDVLEVVVGAEVMVNEMEAEVADAYVPFAAIDAVIVQVPASTKVTTPDDELIVHTDVVELEYVLVPAPADAVDVMVGGVALPE